jgi:pimeloyl-ACP methyl ester carboxylesterase
LASARRDEGTIRLRDGRRLAWAQCGDPDGPPVLFHHGIPSCRVGLPGDPDAVLATGVRLVTADRPGIGASDPLPGRSVAGWASDVGELAGELGLERFAVLGFSAGGPYAAACAHQLPELVTAAGLIAPAPPLARRDLARREPDRRVHDLALRAPWALRAGLQASVSLAGRSPERAVARLGRGRGDADRRMLARTDVARGAVAGLTACVSAGTGGWVEDIRTRMRPWGFSPARLSVPVTLWQGEEDSFVSRAAFDWWERQLPDCDARLLPGEGHFLMYDHTEDILRSLAALAARTEASTKGAARI